MAKFRLPALGGKARPTGGGATIVEIAERRHNIRMAKITFLVIAFAGWPTVAVIASPFTNPLLAMVIGFVVAVALAAVVSLIVLAWPVLRALWHWTFEITLAAGLLAGYLAMVPTIASWAALSIIAGSIGILLVLPWTRRPMLAWSWCAIARHRLRLCFAAFITANRYGSLPFILTARPTPAGERVYVWLRAGLSLADLEARRDKIAVACWARDIHLSNPSWRFSGLVQVDITRRNPLRVTVNNPLTALVPNHPAVTSVSAPTGPHALDLPDVPEDLFTNRPVPVRDDSKPGADTRPNLRPAPPTTPPPPGDNGDDVTDWI